MNIKFLNAKRSSFNAVDVTYSLDETNFVVEWNNIHPGTGEIGAYDLQLNTKSIAPELAVRIDGAISAGEADTNPDQELYLFVRDTFDSMDCARLDTPSFEILNEEEYDSAFYGNQRHLTKLGGTYDGGDDFGLGDWTYQFEVEVANEHGEIESFTVAFQPEERSNGMKAYSGYDLATATTYGYDADESESLLKFCDYDDSVLEALREKAKKAAKAEYERLIRLLKNGEIEANND